MKQHDRMPPARRVGTERATEVSFLLLTYKKWCAGEDNYPSNASRRVMGFGVPEWQREIVWTDEQCVRFVESIWRGISIGVWMLNVVHLDGNQLDGLVVDGQQRLNAIQRYVDGDFPVLSNDGIPLYWSDLTVLEQRRFGKTMFPYIETRIEDEAELRCLYDLHNFSGTPHKEEDRAMLGRAIRNPSTAPNPLK